MEKHGNRRQDSPVEAARAVLIWDFPLRAFHWLLVLTLIGCWITQKLGGAYMDWHLRLGYFALALILFRIAWGFAGTRHARFRSFLTDARRVASYARLWIAGQPPAHAGHNPLGGWAAILMLLSVFVQAVSGLFNSDDIFTTGPWRPAVSSSFADSMSTLHDINFYVLLSLVTVHVLAIAAYRVRFGIRLVWPMITGRKVVQGAHGIDGQRIWPGLLIGVLAGLLIWGLISAAPEPDPTDLFF